MKKPLLSILMLLTGISLKAQNSNNFQKMVDFLPPAPNASAIIKHADLSLNKNSGSPVINIPLFTIKGIKLSTGVSIGYSSTGIKVDEIASRVGMGWALNSGGVITRTIRGWDDEHTTRIAPPFTQAGHNCGTYDFLHRVSTSSNTGGSDSEPDLFNFSMNGISGSFVYDSSMNPVLIPAEKYKIEKPGGPTDNWNFKITTTDGIKYYFGGTNATEKTRRINTCGAVWSAYIPNAWYLVKIEHPNGESINLTYTSSTYTYETGVNETQHWSYAFLDTRDVAAGGALDCPVLECPAAPAPSRCINFVSTEGVFLQSISNAHSSVVFMYESRLDCTDKLLSKVYYFVDEQPAGTFDFTYFQHQAAAYNHVTSSTHQNFTPYLIELYESSPDLAFNKTHKFVYDDPASRPPRFSYAQDHWGYFNGKDNTTFIPRPREFALHLRFPAATANREPDKVFARKGMLTKIVYPTGGIDHIEYESNDEWDDSPDYSTFHEYNCNVTGATNSNNTAVSVSRTVTFTIDNSQVVELDINYSSADPGAYDPIHMQGEIFLSNGSSTIFSAPYALGNYTQYLNPTYPLAAGTYTLEYKAKGHNQTMNIKLKYYPTTHVAPRNKIVGGVRVKRIMTGNPNEKPVVRRFYYSLLDSLHRSSLMHTQTPVYHKDYENAITCEQTTQPGNLTTFVNVYCHLTAMYSGSLVNLFDYGSGLVSYGHVTESIGENFEGGAIQSTFYAGGDLRPSTWWGNDILGAPLSNWSSPLNGKLREEIIYKKPATGPLFPVKKTLYNYFLETRAHTEIYGYTVNKKYTIVEETPGLPCYNNNMSILPTLVNSYDVALYHIDSWWYYLESQAETLYDENGANPLTTTTNFYFDNEQNFQQTRTQMTNSKNEVLKTTNTYPHDYTGNAVYDSMIAKNIISPLVTSKNQNGNSELSLDKINYANPGNNNFVPVSIEKSVKGNALEIEGTINLYDANGNILQFTSKAGIITSIIWGYDYRYPVAQIVSATYANAVAQLTGGSVTALQSMDGAALRTEINRIRTNIPAAAVTSYTYKPKAGVSSITDPNNKTNTYDYDSFDRLLTIKDQDSNVVKKNQYVYASPNAADTLLIYFNAALPKTYSCQTCEPGYIPSSASYNYTVPLGKYISLVSQLAADSMAATDTDGQEYINKNASCINYESTTCSGVGYKLVNCMCQLGTKVCESTTDHGGGTYTVTYHYHWTDNTNSGSYSEIITCTGIDKKLITCICETGRKVCETTTDNGGGSYTVTYHYKWSDSSYSSPITETITCSGADKKMIGCECKTAERVYIYSGLCGLSSENGCCPHMWKCEFYYKWSDNSTSLPTTYFECNAEDCMSTAEEANELQQ